MNNKTTFKQFYYLHNIHIVQVKQQEPGEQQLGGAAGLSVDAEVCQVL